MSEGIGSVVSYKLTQSDADAINGHRAGWKAFLEHLFENVTSSAPADEALAGLKPATGNQVSAGDVFPAVIVRQWQAGSANLKVLLDGNDDHWVTSAVSGTGEGQYYVKPGPAAPATSTSSAENEGQGDGTAAA